MKALVASHVDNIFLRPGEVVLSEKPALITTVLGSCIAVTMFSPATGVGAICHAMLPTAAGRDTDLRYVDVVLPHMYEMMAECGAINDVEVKLFGGARVLDSGNASTGSSIGEDNVSRAVSILAELKLELKARDVGGTRGRRLYFCTRDGDVFMRRIRNSAAVRTR